MILHRGGAKISRSQSSLQKRICKVSGDDATHTVIEHEIMSRILKWDGTEMNVPHELFLRSMRLTFSHWTKHAAMLAAGVLWIRHTF
jgi:hypothetical protein